MSVIIPANAPIVSKYNTFTQKKFFNCLFSLDTWTDHKCKQNCMQVCKWLEFRIKEIINNLI